VLSDTGKHTEAHQLSSHFSGKQCTIVRVETPGHKTQKKPSGFYWVNPPKTHPTRNLIFTFMFR